jgi:ParB/RepB/Spo0J family partition protein
MSTQLIPVENVTDNQFNPRSKYDPDKIKELASSIDQNGLLETPKGHKVAEDMYELAYGGYRLRSFKNLAKREIDQLNDGARQYVVDGKLCMPVDVIEISDTAMVIYALEENIKRQNMTPMDQANAIAKYFDLFPGTKEDDLAKKLSMNQATISNMRRVTRLPKEILKYVDSEEINFTQAKELVPLMDIDGITKGNVESRLIMIDAISLLGTEGYAKTVKGIQKAINKAVISVSLSTDPNSPANPPIFDVSECSKCDKTIKTIGDDGKSTPHCFDSECWNIKQKAAQRKKEEDEVVAAEATRIQKEAEDALAKEQAEKEATEAQAKKAENIPQGITVPEPVIIRVAPSRLDNGDIAQLYSAKEIFAGEPIVGAFNIEGENYPFVNVGTWYDLPGDILAKHGYKIIPHEEFTGEIRSLTPPEGVDAAEYRATLKADPMGPYNGVLVH